MNSALLKPCSLISHLVSDCSSKFAVRGLTQSAGKWRVAANCLYLLILLLLQLLNSSSTTLLWMHTLLGLSKQTSASAANSMWWSYAYLTLVSYRERPEEILPQAEKVSFYSIIVVGTHWNKLAGIWAVWTYHWSASRYCRANQLSGKARVSLYHWYVKAIIRTLALDITWLNIT